MTIYCQFFRSADDLLSKTKYVVAFGEFVGSKPCAFEIGVYSERRFLELKEDYNVIACEKVETEEDMVRVADLFIEKYRSGKVAEPKKSTHENRIKLAGKISSRISSDYISAVYLTGSTVKNTDKDESDLDLVAIRKYCPGMLACSIVKESKEDHVVGVDFWCLTVKDLRKLEKVNNRLIEGKRLLYSEQKSI